MITELESGGGGLDINGIIEQYKVASGGNVNAGDFVKFVTDTENYTQYRNDSYNDAILYHNSVSVPFQISATILDNNTIFIAYGKTNNLYLYGILIKIENETEIVVKCNQQISDINNSGFIISIAKIDENRVFIIHNSSSSYNLYGIVCTISENNIISGTDTMIGSDSYSGQAPISIVKVSDNKFFMAQYRYASIVGRVFNINVDNTFNFKTYTITTTNNSVTNKEISMAVMDKNRIFISYVYHTSNDFLYGIVVTVNNDETITIGTATNLGKATYTGRFNSTVYLNNNLVFIAYNYGLDDYLHGMICEVKGAVITLKSDKLLFSNKFYGNLNSATKLDNSNVCLVYNGGSPTRIKFVICNISDYEITCINNTLLDSNNGTGDIFDSTIINDKKVFIVYGTPTDSSNNYYLRFVLLDFPTYIQSLTSAADKIAGIAKTSGTEGKTIEVYVPEEVSV